MKFSLSDKVSILNHALVDQVIIIITGIRLWHRRAYSHAPICHTQSSS